MNTTYLVRTPFAHEEDLTAWFRFEEGSGTTTKSDLGGFTGTFTGNSNQKPEFVDGKFGKSVKFSKNEWINVNAKPSHVGFYQNRARTATMWVKAYNGQPNTNESGLYNIGDDACRNGKNNNFGLRGVGNDGYRRIYSQHWCWDPRTNRYDANYRD